MMAQSWLRNLQMAKSPGFAQLWLSPPVMKPFAQVPARAMRFFFYHRLLPKVVWSFLLDMDRGSGTGTLRVAGDSTVPCTPEGWKKGSAPSAPLPLHPSTSLPLSPYLVTLVQGLEWAATGFPLPGGSHNPVFCGWKRSEKNQRG